MKFAFREQKVFSINEMYAESPFQCDHVISRNGYCKRVMTSTVEIKRILKTTNSTKNEDEHTM